MNSPRACNGFPAYLDRPSRNPTDFPFLFACAFYPTRGRSLLMSTIDVNTRNAVTRPPMSRSLISGELKSASLLRRLVSLRIRLDRVPSVPAYLARCVWYFSVEADSPRSWGPDLRYRRRRNCCWFCFFHHTLRMIQVVAEIIAFGKVETAAQWVVFNNVFRLVEHHAFGDPSSHNLLNHYFPKRCQPR
jgi:hypothetical protein